MPRASRSGWPGSRSGPYDQEGASRTPAEQLDFLDGLIERFNLIFVEDGFNSNDYESFAELNRRFGHRCLICADGRLCVSNPVRTKAGIEKGATWAMIIKPNQVGTITGMKETAFLAPKSGDEDRPLAPLGRDTGRWPGMP